jgi:hypothetical protein
MSVPLFAVFATPRRSWPGAPTEHQLTELQSKWVNTLCPECGRRPSLYISLVGIGDNRCWLVAFARVSTCRKRVPRPQRHQNARSG